MGSDSGILQSQLSYLTKILIYGIKSKCPVNKQNIIYLLHGSIYDLVYIRIVTVGYAVHLIAHILIYLHIHDIQLPDERRYIL